ncbi:TetR/AcrR family transcriptional regulator [Amycolatopsis roodepoortensis]|uniref:TetR/AcrR family transcriptional regulator n=1 Tax=Amycolatopsis roodepoortensis TaxID=700274 RepID=UPI00214B97CC|nr:TetR/AcrR family transcriptional regulator [Amycolatopsis roodepoortensis]UUV35932.1 TetR/AcrR family transcriptional regulator [Amycolatopsis roodepoortensis]
MPKIWSESIKTHRQAVRDAALDTAATLAGERGLTGVTMSHIAERAGIGRATLYKYFSDVEAILIAWHQRQIARHLNLLTAAKDRATDPLDRLTAALETYALISHEHHGTELAALLHRGEHVEHAREHLRGFVEALIADGARSGDLREDVPPAELATFCLHALTAADGMKSKAAVRRLVQVTLAGLLRHP